MSIELIDIMSCYKKDCCLPAKYGFKLLDIPFACENHAFSGLVSSLGVEKKLSDKKELSAKEIIFCKGINCLQQNKDVKYGFTFDTPLFCEDCVFGGCVKVEDQ